MVDLNLTKRQQEIFDFIKRYSASTATRRRCATSARRSGSTSSSTVHAHLANLEKLGLLRRDPTKPRAIELLVRQGARAVGPAATGCRSSATSPPARRCSPRRTSRSTSTVPPIAGGDEGEFVLRVKRRLDEERRHPRGRLRGRAPAGDRHGRRDRRRAGGRGGDRQALLPENDHIRLQPENPALEPIRAADVARRSARWSASAGRCHDPALLRWRRRPTLADRPTAPLSAPEHSGAPLRLACSRRAHGRLPLDELVTGAWAATAPAAPPPVRLRRPDEPRRLRRLPPAACGTAAPS